MKEKLTKSTRLKMLREILESYKKTGQEPEITMLANYLKFSRINLYNNADYKAVLDEFQIGQKFKEKKIASKEYLLKRINEKDEEIARQKKKIDKLYSKIAEIEDDNKELIEELVKKENRYFRVASWYFSLITAYNRISKNQLPIEPNDIHHLEQDPLDLTSSISNSKQKDVIPFNRKDR